MRISVVGNSGSGKTTAARRIARELGIAHLELDSIRHQANWEELPDDEFSAQTVAFMESNDRWVIDGNYSVIQPEIWRRADTVLWFDLSRRRNMRQIVGRTLRRVVLRQELWNGNRERVTNLTSRDPYESIIMWAWTRHDTYRERYGSAMRDEQWEHLDFVRLRKQEELDRWLTERR